jgi:hypothetical protein
MGHYEKCLAHISVSVKESEELSRQLESKECCQEAKAEISRLKKDNEELRRELAICSVCGCICTLAQHKKNLTGLNKAGPRLDSFLASLGRREKQVTLRAFFNQESQKNAGDFSDKAKE